MSSGAMAHAAHDFIRSKKFFSLRTWFRAIWWATNQKSGVSALGLQRTLGMGSYETAWACLHKLRRAMLRPGRERLGGEVEVDESFVRGHETGGGRRHVGKKALVAIAVEIRGKGMGRVRLRRIPDASERSLASFRPGRGGAWERPRDGWVACIRPAGPGGIRPSPAACTTR